MVADLINITNLVLADDFETWFERTNEVIDALNPLQIYDLDDTGANIQNPLFAAGFVPAGFSLGLQFYRDIRFDGDMLIEVNAEPPLGFDPVTGALELSFTGPFAPPLLTGTPCGGVNAVANDDLYIVHDVSAGVGGTTKLVTAENQLSPRILCDHTFGDGVTAVTITIEGDLIVNGTQTILNTTTVESLDHQIDLNAADAVTITDASNYVGGEDLIVGETVTGGTSGETATVFSWTPATIGNPGSLLVVTNPSGAFTAGEIITGGTSTFSITEGGQADAPGTPAGNDSVAGAGAGGGIRLLSTDGNKTFLWDDADDRWHINNGSGGFQIDSGISLFTRTIEPLTDNLDFIGFGSPTALSLHFHDGNEVTGPDEHWRLTLADTTASGTQQDYSPGAFPLVYPGDPCVNPNPTSVNFGGTIRLEHALGVDPSPAFDLQILFDSVTQTYDSIITGFARNLNADLCDGAHASPVPCAWTIPIADASGQLDPGWIPFTGSVVKEINQTAHGFIVGNVVRIDKITPFGYILAQANSLDNAEAVGVVENVIDANNFELNLRGCMELTTGEWDAVTGDTGGLLPGGVYFLDKTAAGALTLTDPTPGDISKTMLVAIDATTAVVMNYVGGLTDPTSGTPTIQLTNDVLALGLLGSPLTTSIVERTSRQTAVGGTLPLTVQDNDTGAGNRTFEITMTANTTLELQQPAASAVDPVTNSVTLILHQDGTGGWVPSITISGGGTIAWDNSASQPVAQTVALKTTIYVLVNVNDVPGVWYGSRAVFEI